MKIGTPREIHAGERRVALTPDSAARLQKLGYEVLIEAGAGEGASFSDEAYAEAGVEVVADAPALWRKADIILKVRPPAEDEIACLGPDKTLIGFIGAAYQPDLLKKLAATGATVLAMDAVPRISRAQKMDALSSMANIAGYRAVTEAANHFGRFFTGQVTAAGKMPPARVLVIGAGVAGLSAIGTAQSLGAVVRAFDVRPEVAEQIESMGATFLMLDFEEDASGEGGYAKPASPEFIAKEMALFRAQAPEVDIVITTALVPGRPAPKLWPKEMVEAMKPGSVVVDLAAEQGGNCDLTVPDEVVVTENGVKIIGHTDYPSRMATQSSGLYATNLRHMVDELTPDKNGVPVVDMADTVIRGATVVKDGAVTWPPPAIAAPAPARPRPQVAPAPTEEKEAGKVRKGLGAALGFAGVAALLLLIGLYAPPAFMAHFTVFVLACFVGYQVIWNVAPALHTPLMSVTNAISGIIVLGALLQVKASSGTVVTLAVLAALIASINIAGGFHVTRRMLNMFRKG
ncbi:Re/Si-specific NAD(P)(+) transhydrogenase subunit alpha [Chelativorans sp. M5D2P16]|uniref:Re/Si-specific NAD(P)(+) transhydrogenase subunit alpha n=1 Tax=Chelativorans sp. M5D2P16 TaxID=3095678 RepID=UPI002ACA55E5|nr:Re/Si-specific NAD(P)(+) transhydrogenase subunit alpha [Chelativorans sp. M5D2P16]MDZ5698315.1 Re/Si-specific NAD(P)(+) transhydrogenase subunit alpha [Chelativorans sp. M5D2P16]